MSGNVILDLLVKPCVYKMDMIQSTKIIILNTFFCLDLLLISIPVTFHGRVYNKVYHGNYLFSIYLSVAYIIRPVHVHVFIILMNGKTPE